MSLHDIFLSLSLCVVKSTSRTKKPLFGSFKGDAASHDFFHETVLGSCAQRVERTVAHICDGYLISEWVPFNRSSRALNNIHSDIIGITPIRQVRPTRKQARLSLAGRYSLQAVFV